MLLVGDEVGQLNERLPRCLVAGGVGAEEDHVVGGVVGARPAGAYHLEDEGIVRLVEVELQVVVHIGRQRVVPRGVEDDAAVVVRRVDEASDTEQRALLGVGIELVLGGEQAVGGIEVPVVARGEVLGVVELDERLALDELAGGGDGCLQRIDVLLGDFLVVNLQLSVVDEFEEVVAGVLKALHDVAERVLVIDV